MSGSTIKELAEGRRLLIFTFRQGDKIKKEETDVQHGLNTDNARKFLTKNMKHND